MSIIFVWLQSQFVGIHKNFYPVCLSQDDCAGGQHIYKKGGYRKGKG